MSEVKWIKLAVNVFDDEKIKIIENMPEGDAMIVIWFKLLCVAGKSNRDGFLMLTEELAYTEDMLASLFGRDPRLVSLAIKTFERMGMIEVVDNILLLSNWAKHQSAEKLATIREQTKLRTREYRERLKLGDANSVTGASQERRPSQENKTKTKTKTENTETEVYGAEGTHTDAQARHSQPKKTSSRFTPPTVDEIAAHCKEKGYAVDAEHFHAYYEARGWILSNSRQMKSWQAALVTWQKNDTARRRSEPKQSVGKLYFDI